MKINNYTHATLPESNICFIIGSPRSGTTIFCDILGSHPDIERLSEPYFLWDWHYGSGPDDVRNADQATPEVIKFLQNEFALVMRKSGKKVLVEKTPENCFRIPFIQAVFPDAKWIHLVRDGRDVVVSMRTEWQKRESMIREYNLLKLLKTAGRMLYRQQYWRNRWQAIMHEFSQNISINPSRYFNKAKWQGRTAWGPRFPGWQDTLDNVDDIIEFNALQWKACIEFATDGLSEIDQSQRLDIKYETLTENPDSVLTDVFNFIGVYPSSQNGSRLFKESVGKWRNVLTNDEIYKLDKLIGSTLKSLNYDIR